MATKLEEIETLTLILSDAAFGSLAATTQQAASKLYASLTGAPPRLDPNVTAPVLAAEDSINPPLV